LSELAQQRLPNVILFQLESFDRSCHASGLWLARSLKGVDRQLFRLDDLYSGQKNRAGACRHSVLYSREIRGLKCVEHKQVVDGAIPAKDVG
jgi:hypothetical protein